MDQVPLVKEEIEAGAELAREYDKYKPVKAAFWLKKSDDDRKYFYIASERIDDGDLYDAYGEVIRLTTKMQSLDPMRVKLVGAEDPLAKAAADHNARFPSRKVQRFGGTMFGGVFVDDVYLYPSPLPAAAP